MIELGAHSGGAVRHRTAKGVLSLLQVETSLVQSELVLERENESVWGEHSLECCVAEWLLDSVEATRTSVGILVRTSLEPDMVCFKRNPNDDFATFWKRLPSKGHELARVFAVSPVDLYFRTKHRLAGHFARFENDSPVYQMMVCRNLAWSRQEQRVWSKTKFGGAHPQRFNEWRWESCLERAYLCTRLETHGQWAGLRLRKTSASGNLVKVHFSPCVADFV